LYPNAKTNGGEGSFRNNNNQFLYILKKCTNQELKRGKEEQQMD